ncbi:MAG: tyrosine-type recombinase/integrase [Bacteroidales bacterium]|nr:tyrosine-type recombinase/integrase [Bacteroidales bacterium]
MATINYYLSRYIKKDDERGEIQMRFCGNRNFVKRVATGIFITAGNWDAEKGMPKGKKQNKYGDDCEEVRDRLNQLTSFLMRCWEQTDPKELKPDSLTQWMKDIVWNSSEEETYIGGKKTVVNRWGLGSKTQMNEAETKRKKEMAKADNRYFLDVFRLFIDEQLKNGVIVETRWKTYSTCAGIWERMERYLGKRFRIKDLTTADLYEFRSFIINECDLWETEQVTVGTYKKWQKTVEKPVPKKRYQAIYEGYDSILERGVKRRSLNYVVIEFKYLKAFWHWLDKVQKVKVDDIFEGFNMDQSVYGTPYFFSNEDRDKLFEADFSDRPELAVQRDIFVFQSLVGCRIGDLRRLKKSNIVDGKYLQYVAGKTRNESGKIVMVPLHPKAKIILERYKDTDDDRLLPFVADQKYNQRIKEMFKAVPEIDHTVTILDPVTRLEKQVKLSEVASSHMGRRNFCGNLYDAGFRDADIASMSGHAEGSKAISRYRKVSDETKQKMIESL